MFSFRNSLFFFFFLDKTESTFNKSKKSESTKFSQAT